MTTPQMMNNSQWGALPPLDTVPKPGNAGFPVARLSQLYLNHAIQDVPSPASAEST